MDTKETAVAIRTTGRWGKFPTYSAKIGSGSSACVLVKRARRFHNGQRIEYCDTNNLRGMSTGCTPTWVGGVIWLVEHDRLFINRA